LKTLNIHSDVLPTCARKTAMIDQDPSCLKRDLAALSETHTTSFSSIRENNYTFCGVVWWPVRPIWNVVWNWDVRHWCPTKASAECLLYQPNQITKRCTALQGNLNWQRV